jgi:hypothetical protein
MLMLMSNNNNKNLQQQQMKLFIIAIHFHVAKATANFSSFFTQCKDQKISTITVAMKMKTINKISPHQLQS